MSKLQNTIKITLTACGILLFITIISCAIMFSNVYDDMIEIRSYVEEVKQKQIEDKYPNLPGPDASNADKCYYIYKHRDNHPYYGVHFEVDCGMYIERVKERYCDKTKG